MNTTTVTVDDLWPGDIIVVRGPGDYVGTHRVVDIKREGRFLTCASLDGEAEVLLVATGGYSTEVERLA